MNIDLLIERLDSDPGRTVLVRGDRAWAGGDVLRLTRRWEGVLKSERVAPEELVLLAGGGAAATVAAFVALARNRNLVALTAGDEGPPAGHPAERYRHRVVLPDTFAVRDPVPGRDPGKEPLLASLVHRQRCGLILLTNQAEPVKTYQAAILMARHNNFYLGIVLRGADLFIRLIYRFVAHLIPRYPIIRLALVNLGDALDLFRAEVGRRVLQVAHRRGQAVETRVDDAEQVSRRAGVAGQGPGHVVRAGATRRERVEQRREEGGRRRWGEAPVEKGMGIVKHGSTYDFRVPGSPRNGGATPTRRGGGPC